MSIFRVMAGYTYGHADIVRRAMSKKKASVLEAERADFVAGAEKNGMTHAEAEKLFDDMGSFANYAFNKSHAAAYALISYRTAYLKAHHPGAYFAALLTSVLGNQPKMAEYSTTLPSEKASVTIQLEMETDVTATVNGQEYPAGGITVPLEPEGPTDIEIVTAKNGKSRYYREIPSLAGVLPDAAQPAP